MKIPRVTKVDLEVHAALPQEGWFTIGDTPHWIKNREWRCDRLVVQGLLLSRPKPVDDGTIYRKQYQVVKRPPTLQELCREGLRIEGCTVGQHLDRVVRTISHKDGEVLLSFFPGRNKPLNFWVKGNTLKPVT